MKTRRPVPVIILVAILLTGCVQQNASPNRSSISNQTPISETGPTITPSMPYLFSISFTPEKPIYLPGEEVEIKFTFTNPGSKPIVINPFPPAIILKRPGGVAKPPQPAEEVRIFSPGNKKMELKPGETGYLLKWDQRDNDGKQVSPGYYDIVLVNFQVETPGGGNISMGSFSTSTQVFIQFAQGAMETTIAVNKSITRGNVTVTLERLELYPTGGRLYALAQPSDYTPPASTAPPSHPRAYLGWYSIDNTTEQEVNIWGSPSDRGINLTMVLPVPVPADAREITFAITDLEWEGPWEYQIQLKQ